MSSYQYYEFQAIEQPLTQADQDYVNKLSSRVRCTFRRAIFTYSYGDFPYNPGPLSVLEKCFDAMLYVASWGTYQLAFRLPKSVVNIPALETYCTDDIIQVITGKEYVILNIEIHEEEGSCWIEEDNHWLDALLPLRQAIIQGDYRVLYLAWLQAAAVSGYLAEDAPEPPIPNNLQKLDASLQSFVDLLEIDPDLVVAASAQSPTQKKDKEPFKDWIEALSDSEKNKLLIEIIQGDSAVAVQLQAQLRQQFGETPAVPAKPKGKRRSYLELSALADQHRLERKAKEKATRRSKRRQYVESLRSQQPQLWENVKTLIARKQAQPYEQAIQHLIDLRDIAKLEGTTNIFQSRVQQIQRDYSWCSGLLRRIEEANLFT